MRHKTIQKLQRIILAISFLTLAAIGLIGARWAGVGLPGMDGLPPQGVSPAMFNRQLAIISGHAGFDSGAVCENESGAVVLKEVDINAEVAQRVARRLRRAGADVTVLDEYDPRLEGLVADLLLSIHADSCIDASGYKAAVDERRVSSMREQRLLSCIDLYYPLATALPHHPNSVTHNMTQYHAFRRIDPSTPAAILELGFLGGDEALLTGSPQLVVKGVSDALLCAFDDSFLQPPQ